MTRAVALRACALFILLTLVVAAVDSGVGTAATGAFVVIGLMLTVMTAGFASLVPEQVPVRIRANRRR